MGRPFSTYSKIVRSPHNAAPKKMLPHTIHSNAGRERMGWAREPVGEVTPCRSDGRTFNASEYFWNLSLHGVTGTEEISSHMDKRGARSRCLGEGLQMPRRIRRHLFLVLFQQLLSSLEFRHRVRSVTGF